MIDTAQPSTSKRSLTHRNTNWELCVLCQEETEEPLQYPMRSTKAPVGSGYHSLANDLIEFEELGQMPLEIPLDRLDDGNGIEATLKTNNAKWHKTCRLKYTCKLQRRRKSIERAKQAADSKIRTRSIKGHGKTEEPLCLFCNQPAGSEALHEASTIQLDENVRNAARQTEDTELLAKLSAGDMIAIEAKYHIKCLRTLYNKARQMTSVKVDNEEAKIHGIAFAELVAFIEDAKDDDCAPVFKLADLGNLYKTRLEQLDAKVGHRVHTTRLKARLLSVFPGLQAHSQGRDTLLTFKDDIGCALKKACDYDSDAIHLARAAQVVRREMFCTKFTFDGSFHQGCQKESVSPSLLALVNMILDGANIKHQTHLVEGTTTPAAITISQLLVFNSVKHARTAKSSSTVRHSRDRETPLTLYLALKVHAVTRKKELIDTLFHLGMCVSYDRLLQVSSDIANGVCQRFRVENVVCPPKMRNGLFTTAAVDNIDHNPSSGTAKESFHGTGISLMQHPTHECAGSDRGVLVINPSTTAAKSITPLPEKYTNVQPAAISVTTFTAPPVNGPVKPSDFQMSTKTKEEEYEWLKAVLTALDEQDLNGQHWVSWGAYHANMQQAVIPPAAINALLPLFLDNAHSIAMIKHSMDIVREAVEHLNPGQVPVLAADQPLYSIAKQIQWTWPESHGEDRLVIMFGGLHVEMAALKERLIRSIQR